MRALIKVLFLVTLSSSCGHSQHWGYPDKVFNLSQSLPTDGPSEAIGGYSAGCLKGAQSLRPEGKGHLVMRASRGRFWGHSDLVTFIEQMGEQWAKKQKTVMLVGDLGQARGGPMLSQHLSHQSGLDVDIWMLLVAKDELKKLLSRLGERETLAAKSVLTDSKQELDRQRWGRSQQKLLLMMAKHPRVERILVHPLIKQRLCQLSSLQSKSNQEALKKIRPWWGHDDHFHVRLKCPLSSPECVAQTPPTEVSCDQTLDWWFSEEAKSRVLTPEEKEALDEDFDLGGRYLDQLEKLPVQCQEILR